MNRKDDLSKKLQVKRQKVNSVNPYAPQEPVIKEEQDRDNHDAKNVVYKHVNFTTRADIVKRYKQIALDREVDLRIVYEEALEKGLEYLESQQND